MKLIEPGNYNFSYNQEYLLTKFWGMDIYTAIFWSIWISVFLGILVFWLYRKYKDSKIQTQLEMSEKYKHDLFIEFHETCRLIYEDLNVFKRPESMVEKMYYPRLKEVIYEMSLHKKFMEKNYRHLIPDYDSYREKLINSEK